MASVFASPFIGALGWALLHFLWQGALVALLAGLALRVLRGARPQLRYIVSLSALALCVALPFAQLVVALPSSAAPVAEAQANLALTPFSADAGMRSWVEANMGALVAGWLACVVLLTLRMGAGMLWIGSLKRAALASGASWQDRLDTLGARMRMARRVPLLVVEGLDSPVAAGILRPVVLVPAALVSGMPVALLEALLAHELAHVQRHDYLVNLLQGAAEVLLFYHPAVWWLSRRVRIEREQVADDLAAQALGDVRSLALALQALDSFQQGASAAAFAPAARGGNLLARIQRLLLPHTRPSAWQTGFVLPALALASVMLTACVATAPLAPATANTQAPDTLEAKPTHATVNPAQCKKPVYPPQAMAQNRMGRVTMEFLVDVAGKVKDGRIVKSSGHADLDVAAFEALKLCGFTPAMRNGQAEESWTKMMYVWQLK